MLLRKPVLEYYLRGALKAMGWFLLVWTGIFVLTTTGVGIINIGGNANFNGAEFAFLIFFFIAGMSDFTADLHFTLQHGVSRRSAFVSFIAYMLIAGAVWTMVLYLTTFVFGAIGSMMGSVRVENSFPLLYSGWLETTGTISGGVVLFLLYWAALLMVGALGYFIACLFYRISTLGKTIFWAALIGSGVVLPLLNNLTGGLVWQAAQWLGQTFIGRGAVPNPWNGIGVFLVFAAIWLVISWLLIRRCTLKK